MSEKVKNSLKKAYNFSNSWTGTFIIVLLVIFFIAQAFVIPSGSMKKTLLVGDHLFVKKFAYGIPTPHIPWLELPVFPDFDEDGHLIEGERPKRGDIVIFRYPPDPKFHFVKRCVAIGGDEVLYTDRALYIHPHEGDEYLKANYPKESLYEIIGKLWVKNPYMLEHPLISYEGGLSFDQMLIYSKRGELPMDRIVINDTLFFYTKVEDDHYFMVGDNRDHSNDSRFWGSVPYRYIVGKPWFIYFSWDDDYVFRWDRMFKTVETLEEEAKEGLNVW